MFYCNVLYFAKSLICSFVFGAHRGRNTSHLFIGLNVVMLARWRWYRDLDFERKIRAYFVSVVVYVIPLTCFSA